MHFESSPGTSPSQPISIGRMQSSPTSSFVSIPQSGTFGSPLSRRTSACAYPSWPQSESLGNAPGSFRSSAPSSFISDEDLFGFDDETPFLSEAPAPPRDVTTAQAFPLLPLYASAEKTKKKRRSSTKTKVRRSSKPMTPISESPEAPE
ncbi:hypothetical protein EJ05DRAFT_496673 [Pseudovirgaria hyperparasitica]|uniref:Uncharacterized protein n=1 Tax=Pseudovirgaria hyperparasitica TaxID=470096 RepID=A0A6A6WIF0_9PEZI|nr:uncharacterized protein EJ05DRAFT_496673 [Pseudovirgaria hyperparasitica]KAF2761776.1 hypothetical protein EJ05DRAFT_496673 [Pseudovirgaria hyperparasitica]